MALRLFEHPLSPYARKVKLVLYEKGIPVERVFVSPSAPSGDRDFQEFVLASPRLEVPCLVDGKVRVFESRVIADYVEDRWPDPPLWPEGAAERARVRMLETICDTQLEAIQWGLMEIEVFHRAEGELAAALKDRARGQLERLWTRLDRELEGREWMNGARFGRGDAAVLPHIGTSAAFGLPIPERFARLHAWHARCRQRESVKREGAELLAWLEQNPMGGGRTPLPAGFKRQYRDHRLEWMIRSGGLDVVQSGLADDSIRFSEEF